MLPDELSDTEQAMQRAFRTGEHLSLAEWQDRVVRSSVVRFLLLGGLPSTGGHQPALRLAGAQIAGKLDLAYTEITAPVSLRDCHFDEAMELYGARLSQFSLRRCTFPGLVASNAVFRANLRMEHCRSSGTIYLVGAQIGNALILNGTQLSASPQQATGGRLALDATRLRVGADILAHNGFRCNGELRLTNAEVAGSLRWEGATLHNEGGYALFAPDLRVGAIANLCEGFRAEGTISLHFAHIASRLCFDRAALRGGETAKLGLRHVQTRDLVLLPTEAPAGTVDLRNARVGLLRDDPATWPPNLYLNGLVYEALTEAGEPAERLGWLRRDPDGYRPQPYGQLASVYRVAGRDADARGILLAAERHQRATSGFFGRLWGLLQDFTVGYGYRPTRALIWLTAFMLIGTGTFHLHPPRPVNPAAAPEFAAAAYTADLLLPVVDLGQQSAYNPAGATKWLAYFLILAGLLFVTTIAAAAARQLRRT